LRSIIVHTKFPSVACHIKGNSMAPFGAVRSENFVVEDRMQLAELDPGF
jgi:hypothetical protein